MALAALMTAALPNARRWVAALPLLHEAGRTWARAVQALDRISEASFEAIDVNLGGYITVSEWCGWCETCELRAGTSLARELATPSLHRPPPAEEHWAAPRGDGSDEEWGRALPAERQQGPAWRWPYRSGSGRQLEMRSCVGTQPLPPDRIHRLII